MDTDSYTSIICDKNFIEDLEMYKKTKVILFDLQIVNFLLGLGLSSSNNNCGFNIEGMNDVIKKIIDKLQVLHIENKEDCLIYYYIQIIKANNKFKTQPLQISEQKLGCKPTKSKRIYLKKCL